ncbi:MAG: hypothetical protein KIT46_10035 [Anaerolineales bacterium]|nr:hypothetical protein [Anaerolineales bacterium]MCW5856369.1 hypothetical protein [Anaerolineales bacterium]
MRSSFWWTLFFSFLLQWLMPLGIGLLMVMFLGAMYLLAPLGVDLARPWAGSLAFLGIQTLQVLITTPLLVAVVYRLGQRLHSGWLYLWAALAGWLLPLTLHFPYAALMRLFQPEANYESLLGIALVIIALSGALLGLIAVAVMRRAQQAAAARATP